MNARPALTTTSTAKGWTAMAIKQCSERWCAPHRAHVDSACAACGITFQGHARTLARGHGKFCSQLCAKRSRNRPNLTVEERACRRHEEFWCIVTKSDGCWLWAGKLDANGYGTFGHMFAHRLSWLLTHGTLPPRGLELDHLCRVPACVRVDHLEPVTHRENILRGQAPIALNAAKTHCPAGHVLVLRHGPRRGNPAGTRYCNVCDGLRQQAKRARRRASGLCQRCGAPVVPGWAHCAAHVGRGRKPGARPYASTGRS